MPLQILPLINRAYHTRSTSRRNFDPLRALHTLKGSDSNCTPRRNRAPPARAHHDPTYLGRLQVDDTPQQGFSQHTPNSQILRYFAPRWRPDVHWPSRAPPRSATPRPVLRGASTGERGAGQRGGGRRRSGEGGPDRAVAVCVARAVAAMSANGSAAAEPRLCHVRKVPDFDGYGFNLHAEKGKPGQYIGKVDEGSPAEAAGLRRGDRILEVNGQSIAGETHKQVVARIKQRPDDAELLVVAPAPGDPLPAELDAPPSPPSPAAVPVAPAAPAGDAEAPRLNLTMTAAEMRAHLAAKKKVDPKKVPMDLKSKFDIVKKL
ncbi:Na(+)/H(+) exchange regulatory cofactor NHE-RF2 [Papilio machaon]|uniref:Na(+)/H(+) exchange regulatory cofactor NHE-RF2 n=1 Tax=Papilio machaon TaxID=76193 RepID=A0A0N1IPZ4_PAPMA|nr:Na(+)/H(+) exchange regulatory cofactor NHE-RF2 [Papilio machaon]